MLQDEATPDNLAQAVRNWLDDKRASAALAAEFDGFLRTSNLLGQTRLAGGDARPCEFKNSMTALRGTPLELINQFHPLIKFISAKLREAGAHFFPLVSLTIPVGKAHEAFMPGNYMFCVKRWHFGGLKDEEQLAVAVRPLDGDGGAIRLEQADFQDVTQLDRLAAVVEMTPEQFQTRFGYLVGLK